MATSASAPSSGSALCRHSRHSSIGTLSTVMPPPTPSSILPAATSKVRIATLNSTPQEGLA